MREDDILNTLNKYFGYEALRPGQLPIILKVLDKRDVIICKESGFGKSLCFQLPGIMREGLVVVFSNLLSRIERKCQELSSKQVKCEHLNNIVANDQAVAKDLRNVLKNQNKVWDDLRCVKTSKLKFLYITLPYYQNSARLRDTLKNIYRKKLLQAVVIDEITYSSQWIDSFKRTYSELGSLRDACPNSPFLCFIGPTSQEKFSIIKDTLRLQHPYKLNEPSTRISVSHQMMYVPESLPTERLVKYIKATYHRASGIVYCYNEKDCGPLVRDLKDLHIASILYTRKLTDKEKSWINHVINDGVVIVCLSGSPVDFDFEKIAFTIHICMPIALDIYIAETNIVGKNGAQGNCIILYSKEDTGHHLNARTAIYKEAVANADTATKRKEFAKLDNYRRELFELTLYSENQSLCRQALMLTYLNDENVVEPCGVCDVCLIMRESIVADMSYSLKKILMAIWTINRHQKGLKSDDYVFASITFLIDLLLGDQSADSSKKHTIQLSDKWFFGSFGSWNETTLHTLIIILLIQKFASINLVANDEFTVYQNLVITPKGQKFLESTSEFGIPFSCKDARMTKWLDSAWVKNQFLNDLVAIVNYHGKYHYSHGVNYKNYCIHLSCHAPGTREEFQKIKAWKMERETTKQPTKLDKKYALQSLEGFEDDDIQYKRLMKLRYKCMKKCSSPAAEIGISLVDAVVGFEVPPLTYSELHIKSISSQEAPDRLDNVTDRNDNVIHSTDERAHADVAKRKHRNTELDAAARNRS